MKKYIHLILTLVAAFLSNALQAQSQPGTLKKYYAGLAKSPDERDKVLLEQKLYTLLKSKDEKDWMTAQDFFYDLKKLPVADSIEKAAKIRFTSGEYVRNDEVKVVYDEKDAAKKEQLYKAWVKKFPPEKFGTDRIQYDYARNSVAIAYGKEDNVKKALQYANMIETPVWKGEGWAGAGSALMKNKHLNEAAELFKKARDNSYKYITTNRNDYGGRLCCAGLYGL